MFALGRWTEPTGGGIGFNSTRPEAAVTVLGEGLGDTSGGGGSGLVAARRLGTIIAMWCKDRSKWKHRKECAL